MHQVQIGFEYYISRYFDMKTKLQGRLSSYFRLDEGVKMYFTFKNYATLIAVYLLGYSSLLVANIYYADDHVRRLYGGIVFKDVGRWLNEYIITLWNFKASMLDATPLFQLYAIFLLATLSLVLSAVFKVKQSYGSLCAAAFVGLFPFLYGNMVFNIDSPFMIASLLAAVFPFLWTRNKKTFWILSFVAGFLLLALYQISFTAYYIVLVVLIIDNIADRNPGAVKPLLIGGVSFGVGVIANKLFMPHLVEIGLVKTGISFSKVFVHLSAFWKAAIHLLDVANIVVVSTCSLFFIIAIWRRSKMNFAVTALLALVACASIVVLMAGANIYLAEFPEMRLRYYIVFNFAIGVLAVYGLKSNYKIVGVANFVILMYLLNLTNGYGNALKAKNDYRERIYAECVYDFKQLVNDKPYEIAEVRRVPGTRDPNLFNVDSMPFIGKQHHSRMIAALIREMDIGFDQLNLEAFIRPTHGNVKLYDGATSFALLLSKPEYDIYFDGITAYKVIFRY